jgi:putative hemolysin
VLELTIVAVLIALNGLFSLSELVVVSSRKAAPSTELSKGRFPLFSAIPRRV